MNHGVSKLRLKNQVCCFTVLFCWRRRTLCRAGNIIGWRHALHRQAVANNDSQQKKNRTGSILPHIEPSGWIIPQCNGCHTLSRRQSLVLRICIVQKPTAKAGLNRGCNSLAKGKHRRQQNRTVLVAVWGRPLLLNQRNPVNDQPVRA